jgi:hypothetical protein
VVLANTNTQHSFTGWVIVDNKINDTGTKFRIVYNNIDATGDSPVEAKKRCFTKMVSQLRLETLGY